MDKCQECGGQGVYCSKCGKLDNCHCQCYCCGSELIDCEICNENGRRRVDHDAMATSSSYRDSEVIREIVDSPVLNSSVSTLIRNVRARLKENNVEDLNHRVSMIINTIIRNHING